MKSLTLNILAKVSQNPFDIISNEAIQTNDKPVLWGHILLSTLAFTFLFTFFRPLMTRILTSILSVSQFKQFTNNIYSKGILDFIFPFFVSIYTLGIFCKMLFPNWPVYYTFLMLCLGIVIKLSTIRTVGYLFGLDKASHYYTSTVIILYVALGTLLAPINLFLIFPNTAFEQILLKTGILLLIIMFLIRYLRGAQVNFRLIAHNKFHFLLYICTLELGPFLVIYKLIFNQLSL